MTERVCQHCGASISGMSPKAKFCRSACGKAQARKRDPEKHRAEARKRREANREKYNEAARKWRAENPERVKAAQAKHYRNNRESRRENSRSFDAKNPEMKAARWARWKENHPGHCQAYLRQYKRTRAAAQHMQEAIAAAADILAMIEQLEDQNDQ